MNRREATGKTGRFMRAARTLLAVLMLLALFFLLSDNPCIAELRGRLLGTTEAVTSEGNENSEAKTGAAEEYEESGHGDDTVVSSGSADSETGNGSEGTGAESVEWLNPGALPEYNGSNYINVAGGTPAFPERVFVRAGIKGYEGGDSRDAGTDTGVATSNSEAGSIAANRYIKTDRNLYTEGSKTGRIDSIRLTPYEYYGELDELGRCTVAYGCLGEETMPADGEERGDISKIHPSGWAKAQGWERCHLIAWALSDENANERNLVTGTHYMNHDGMRPLEEEVEHYIWNTGNHVLYMSRPIFTGDELVPRGVQMIAWSCEDHGEGMSFNVYCFNVTPDAEINYTNGVVTTEEQAMQTARQYVLNTRSGVFHYPSCEGAKSIYKKNRKEVTATRKEMTDQGYIPCGYCEP